MELSPIRVVFVENEHFWVETIESDFKKYKIEIDEVLRTEHEFRQRLPIWRQTPPDAFVLNDWIPWTEPAPVMPEPTQDVINEGYHINAGLRMRRYLLEDPNLQNIPVVMWAFDCDNEMFQRDNRHLLPPRTLFVAKGDEAASLALTVRSLVAACRT